MYEPLAILAVFTLIYSVFAGGVERTWISGPMIFVAFGLLIGPLGLGLIGMTDDAELLSAMAELTLALVLFTDAAGTDYAVLRRARKLPIRLLAIGLPLTILLGFGVGTLLFGDLPVLEVALIATMLAPTDAALGQAVVTNEAVPNSIRQGLNVESGLNDGICVPILFLFLSLIEGRSGDASTWQMGVRLFAEVVGLGLLVGVGLTLAGVGLLRFSERRGNLSATWSQIPVIGLAFACYGAAEYLGGSGFIASFTGGLIFGALLRRQRSTLLEAGEGIGKTFALLTWVLFGAAVVGQSLSFVSWQIVLYALLSLTVVRMLPVVLVLTGLGINAEGKLFIGWFGPRGLASIVFAVIVLNANLEHGEIIGAIIACTVLLSVLGHGMTANPWAKSFGARHKPAGGGAG